MGGATLSPDEALGAVKVASAMHEGLVTCPGDASLVQVAATMAEHGIHCVLVSDLAVAGAPAWGVVSDLDLASSATGRGVTRKARDLAGTPVVRVAPDDTLEHAAQLMAEYQTSHLVVVDPARSEPVGVVSTLDVAGALARS